MKKLLSVLLAALTCLFLVACAPADLDKAEEKMKDAGYDVVVTEDGVELFYGEEAEGMIIANKVEGGITNLKSETVTAILFESASAASDYYKDKKDDAEEEDGYVYKKSGKWVIGGTEEAVKEFLKIF